MIFKRYMGYAVLVFTAIVFSCEPKEELFPLPYDDRDTGSYLRVISTSSFVWDINDLPNSGFEAVYESVDENFGADLDRVEWYATYRSAGGAITAEALVKTMSANDMGFDNVEAPSGSKYLRSEPIRVTAQETLTALNTLTTDPDGTTCTNIFPDICPAIAFPGTLGLGDRVIFRVKIYDVKGRAFTVNNPQVAAAPKLGNPNEANITPNLTGGIFYSSPMSYTMFMQRMTDTATPDPYTGTYRMAQVGRWAPDFATNDANREIMRTFPQAWMRPFVFGTSSTDSTQVVTLEKVPGGLPTQRRFTCLYRGQTISMIINFERQVFGLTGAGLTAAGVATLNAIPNPAPPTIGGLGFPAGTTNTNLGSIFVPLANTGVSCTSDRLFYQMTGGQFNSTIPGAPGEFVGDALMPLGIPRRTWPNRGYYRFDRDGLTPGDVFSLAVDDDVDEYGRRNGYCNWYTRVYLTFTKL